MKGTHLNVVQFLRRLQTPFSESNMPLRGHRMCTLNEYCMFLFAPVNRITRACIGFLINAALLIRKMKKWSPLICVQTWIRSCPSASRVFLILSLRRKALTLKTFPSIYFEFRPILCVNFGIIRWKRIVLTMFIAGNTNFWRPVFHVL